MHTREEQMMAFGRYLDVLDALRENCPWDRKQTNESLRPNTIEETYELCDALIKDDANEICKELGDVLLHICFYAKIGAEKGQFDIADVFNKSADKLIFRHPHVFHPSQVGAEHPRPLPFVPEKNPVGKSECSVDENISGYIKAETVEQVLDNWEQIKQKEKDGNKTVLAGVPCSLPSLIKAYRIQDKARHVGFDWERKEEVWAKVREELDEFEEELNKGNKEKSTEELGDFLFSIINAARLYHLNPDNALERTNQKFIHRFNYIEEQTRKCGKSLNDLTLKEMDELWNEAKNKEK
ncbi:MAG: nucleoside triphosphate pyrophosphohydrolase [Prevotella sp.]|nr:nucleoside triphosphate pyrophosphohydrolase [Prevotella sp.]